MAVVPALAVVSAPGMGRHEGSQTGQGNGSAGDEVSGVMPLPTWHTSGPPVSPGRQFSASWGDAHGHTIPPGPCVSA